MGWCFHKKPKIKKKIGIFFTFNFFLCYYCSIDLKRQSEHSRLRPDTSNFVLFEIGNLRFFQKSSHYFSLFTCVLKSIQPWCTLQNVVVCVEKMCSFFLIFTTKSAIHDDPNKFKWIKQNEYKWSKNEIN